MRVNVYDQNLTARVEPAFEQARNGQNFKGVRFYAEEKRMHTENDEDTGAVTFWYHEDADYERDLLIKSFAKALRILGVDQLPPEEDPAQ